MIILTTKLVESYCQELRIATMNSIGCDPISWGDRARQFFLGNGGCWSVGYVVADNLRTKLPPGKVSRVWHPHEIAGAIMTSGFASSFNQLLDSDGLGEADLVHLISGSGRSANLINVAELVAERGATVLAHCGHNGGPLRCVVSEGVQITSFDQQIVEDALLLRLWPGRGVDQNAISVAVESLTIALQAEIPNLASTALAVAEAIEKKMPIGVVALDVAAVSASAEHVAHNLSWDMCWDAPDLHPNIHFALSSGLLTAVANDTGLEAEPFEHLLRPARSQGLVVNLGRGRTQQSLNAVEPDLGISPMAFESLTDGTDLITEPSQDTEFMCAVFVQLWGHVLIRLGRSLLRTHDSPNDHETRLNFAQRSIAPRMERYD